MKWFCILSVLGFGIAGSSCNQQECITCSDTNKWPAGVLCKESYQTAGSDAMPWNAYRDSALANGCELVDY